MRRYVALGDSMSIDDYAGGPGRGAARLLHRNQDADFPEWVGRDLAAGGWGVEVLARDGAVVADVLNRQLPRLGAAPDLVTVTMGGNDLMAGYGDDSAAVGRVAAQGPGPGWRRGRGGRPSTDDLVKTSGMAGQRTLADLGTPPVRGC